MTIDCPVCGEPMEVYYNPGEPAIRYPNDAAYPGSGPTVDVGDDACQCGDSKLVRHEQYWNAVVDAAEDEIDSAQDARDHAAIKWEGDDGDLW